jgi:hypothetical protein
MLRITIPPRQGRESAALYARLKCTTPLLVVKVKRHDGSLDGAVSAAHNVGVAGSSASLLYRAIEVTIRPPCWTIYELPLQRRLCYQFDHLGAAIELNALRVV